MKELTFITGNQGKADFLAEHLGVPVKHHKLDLEEPQSLDLHEIVEHKARQAYDILQTTVLVEDASLVFAAMGKLPGPFIRWFIDGMGYDGLARLASALPDQTAIGTVCYGLYDGKTMHFFDGEMRGRITDQVYEGPMGFGFDCIFINDGFTVTRSQMTKEDHARTSYRTPGIQKLRTFLTKS